MLYERKFITISILSVRQKYEVFKIRTIMDLKQLDLKQQTKMYKAKFYTYT